MVHEMLESIWSEEKVPAKWEKSETVLIYKQKEEPLECGKLQRNQAAQTPHEDTGEGIRPETVRCNQDW